MFGSEPPPRRRMPPENVAALVNAGIVLLVPIALLLAFLLRDEDMHTVTAYVSPRWVIILRRAMAVVVLFAPFIGLAAIAAARTWAHAKDYLEHRSRGWQGVAEAGGLGLVPAVLILIPATIRSPLEAPPYIAAYAGGALVIGLACGLVLRTTALLVLRVLRRT